VQKDINARIYLLSIAAVVVLYVAVSLIVALARFPGQAVDDRGGYRPHDSAAVAFPDETAEFFDGTLPVVVVRSPDDGRHSSVAPSHAIAAKPGGGVMVACVPMPRY